MKDLKNYGKLAMASVVFSALFLAIVAASTSQASASNISLSGFSVTPAQAMKGADVTGSVTIKNLDATNPVSVVVTFYDGGAPVADNSANPANVPAGGTTTVSLPFKTAADPPHCYVAEANPGSVTLGFCEPGGHILGGTSVPVFTLGLIVSAIAAASIAIAGIVPLARRRRVM